MAYKVKITRSAERDILDLIAYLTTTFGESTARKAFASLRRAFDKLARFPELGTSIAELGDLSLPYHRSLVLPPHTRILYQVAEDHHTIYIHIVCNTRQDFESLCLKRLSRL